MKYAINWRKIMSYIKMKELKLQNYTYDEHVDFEVEWEFVKEEIEQIAYELKVAGWEYFSAGGYMGWNKTPNNTGIYELNGDTLRDILFCYDTEMNINIDFTYVDRGIFEVKMSHHDSPTGETVYFVKELDLDSESEWENPRTHCIDVAIEKGLR